MITEHAPSTTVEFESSSKHGKLVSSVHARTDALLQQDISSSHYDDEDELTEDGVTDHDAGDETEGHGEEHDEENGHEHDRGNHFNDEEDTSYGYDETSFDETDDEWSPEGSLVENKPILKKLDRAAHAVFCTKMLVVVVLLACAVTAGTLTYILLTEDKSNDFEASYKQYANQVLRAANSNAAAVYHSLGSFAALYPAYALEVNSSVLPFVTLKDFEKLAEQTRKVSRAELLTFCAYLTTDDDRLIWENYTVDNQWWINVGFQQADPNYTGHEADHDRIPAYIWSGLDDSGVNNSMVPIPRPYDEEPYLPIWQMSPPPVETMTVNLDLKNASKEIAEIVNYSLEFRVSVLSHPIANLSDFGNNFNITDAAEPHSIFVEPVLMFLEDAENSPVVGTLVAVIPWSGYFHNLLPNGIKGITVVIESCGFNSTYELDGANAIYKGSGSLPENEYLDMSLSSSFIYSNDDANQTFCQHMLHVYPSSTYADSFSSNTAMIATVVVVGIFLFAILVFLTYDLIVTIRQSKVQNRANRTGAIIEQFFPERIREQLFKFNESNEKEKKKQQEKEKHNKLGNFTRRRARKVGERRPSEDSMAESLESFLLETEAEDHKIKGQDHAIAELYPETTIMFADIPGFTAWSSIREPAQIFMLLEAIFQAFDENAKRRRVFKVETVGDCYVAAVGVPEPCVDHAVVMARFARDCMCTFNEVVNSLELTLGPDTSELGIRIGLHSGPVTAGVLRGDRARFQLFGDTMNTTARVETTGAEDCIHLSEQTASFLMAAGKTSWIVPRVDQVEAKGKGKLTTYWLKTRRNRNFSSDESTNYESTYGDHESMDSSTNEDDSTGSFADEVAIESALHALDARLTKAKSTLSVDDKGRPSLVAASLVMKPANALNKERIRNRLVAWNCELLAQLLRQLIARRNATQARTTNRVALNKLAKTIGRGFLVVEEVAEVITLPEFDERAASQEVANVQLTEQVQSQLYAYVDTIACMYRDNPFHNFEHASHVTMSVSKLLSRIVAPSYFEGLTEQAELHDHTYGITSDPLTQFAVVLSGLVHDVDHRGVPNFVLANEDQALAAAYKGKSIAEQNSVDLAWNALMGHEYEELRECIFADIAELRRFRQLLVNSVIATDIFDKELGALRKNRWDKAFAEENANNDRVAINRKATIVIEHLIQASDVAHTMQHWQVYQKWNQRLFSEMYLAFVTGRSQLNPADMWYAGEIGFFDNYIIPLAKKLKDCGVFGVSSDEYLNYALNNRKEWENKGQQIVAEMVLKCQAESQNLNNISTILPVA